MTGLIDFEKYNSVMTELISVINKHGLNASEGRIISRELTEKFRDWVCFPSGFTYGKKHIPKTNPSSWD